MAPKETYDDDLLMVEENLEGVTEEDLEKKTFDNLPPGRHLCKIVRVEGEMKHAEDESFPQAMVMLEAIAGEHTGVRTIDTFQLPHAGEKEWRQNRRAQFLSRIGAIKAGEKKAINWKELVGRQVYVTVEEGKPYKDKKTGQEKAGGPRPKLFNGYESAEGVDPSSPEAADAAGAEGGDDLNDI